MLTFFLTTGCSPSFVVYTDYHTHKDLASYNVGTPDPAFLSIDTLGQSLVFEWTVPKELIRNHAVRIDTYIRLRDKTEHVITFPVPCRSGHARWDLSGEDYFSTGGIFTFYSTLYVDEAPFKTAVHPLYTPLIVVGSKPPHFP